MVLAAHLHRSQLVYFVVAFTFESIFSLLISMTSLFEKLRGTARRRSYRTIPTLPLDIVDIIFQKLELDNATLDSCSLVCRTWACYTRPHRFSRTIVVNRAKLVKLLRLLDSPHCTLRPYVRSMTMDQAVLNGGAWMESFFALIRRKDIPLQELTVPVLPSGLNMSFLRPSVIPLRSLHINVKESTVAETMQFVSLFCDSLESLSLRGCSTGLPTGSTHRYGEWRHIAYPVCLFTRLRNLHIEGVQWMTGYMEWFKQCAGFCRLSGLYLSFGYFGDACRIGNGINHGDADLCVGSFLVNACGAIQYLTLDYDWSSPVSQLDLNTLPRLSQLSVIWHGRSSRDINAVADLISSARMSSLFSIHLSNLDFDGGFKKSSVVSAWSRLDAALSRTHPAVFPCLRIVEVSPARLLALLPGCKRTVGLYSSRSSRKTAWKFSWKNSSILSTPYDGTYD